MLGLLSTALVSHRRVTAREALDADRRDARIWTKQIVLADDHGPSEAACQIAARHSNSRGPCSELCAKDQFHDCFRFGLSQMQLMQTPKRLASGLCWPRRLHCPMTITESVCTPDPRGGLHIKATRSTP